MAGLAPAVERYYPKSKAEGAGAAKFPDRFRLCDIPTEELQGEMARGGGPTFDGSVLPRTLSGSCASPGQCPRMRTAEAWAGLATTRLPP